MIDTPTVALVDQINAAIPRDAPFDMVVSALECLIAKRIMDQSPCHSMMMVAGQMVARHVELMMAFEKRRRESN